MTSVARKTHTAHNKLQQSAELKAENMEDRSINDAGDIQRPNKEAKPG